jgi:hypothetical protein
VGGCCPRSLISRANQSQRDFCLGQVGRTPKAHAASKDLGPGRYDAAKEFKEV